MLFFFIPFHRRDARDGAWDGLKVGVSAVNPGTGRGGELAGGGELDGFLLQFPDGLWPGPGLAVCRVVAGSGFVWLEEMGESTGPHSRCRLAFAF
jgi:hypothetical protein